MDGGVVKLNYYLLVLTPLPLPFPCCNDNYNYVCDDYHCGRLLCADERPSFPSSAGHQPFTLNVSVNGVAYSPATVRAINGAIAPHVLLRRMCCCAACAIVPHLYARMPNNTLPDVTGFEAPYLPPSKKSLMSA